MSFVPDKPEGCIDTANQALRVNIVAGAAGGGGAVTQATSPWVVQDAAAETSLATIAGAPPPSAAAIAAALANPLPVSLATAPSTPVTGTFWQGTQPVSGTIATNADTSIDGTVAPSKGVLILGQSDDVTPIYAPLPLSLGGESLVVSGFPAQMVDLLAQIVARLDAINVTLGMMQGTYIDPNDVSQTIQ